MNTVNFLVQILMNAFFSISVNTKTFCSYVIVKIKFLRIFYVLLLKKIVQYIYTKSKDMDWNIPYE